MRGGEDQQARIAIELHDDTVQVMTAILFQLERTLDVDDPARQTLVEMLRAVIERTRRLMFELRPQLLEKEGLQAMLTEMVKDGPWETADVDVQIGRQSDTLEALLYRTLRELILNARKHSQARSLSVTGRERGGRLTSSGGGRRHRVCVRDRAQPAHAGAAPGADDRHRAGSPGRRRGR